jgi:hypothetical protein
MEAVGILYGHLVHFTDILYIIWPFGIFPPFWYVVPRLIWQPWVTARGCRRRRIFCHPEGSRMTNYYFLVLLFRVNLESPFCFLMQTFVFKSLNRRGRCTSERLLCPSE